MMIQIEKKLKSLWSRQIEFSVVTVYPLAAKLFNWNFHPLEAVSR